MVKHAQRKHKTRTKKMGGVAVNSRYRIEAYVEDHNLIVRIDTCADKKNLSRSQYITDAVAAQVERDYPECV